MIGNCIRKIGSCFSTLIIAEHNSKSLLKGVAKLVKASQKLNQESHLLIIGHNVDPVVKHAQSTLPDSVIKKIIVADAPSLASSTTETVEGLVKQLIAKNKYTNVVALASNFGKDVIPRVAASFDSQPVGDIIEIIVRKQTHQNNITIQEPNVFVRPTYAGNALSKVKSNDALKFLTFRASSFEEAAGKCDSVPVEKVIDVKSSSVSEFVKEELSASNKPELSSARIVVSGGRGVKSKENFQIIEDLANAFGDAAVGASRAAVDAGYCPNDLQVGQTGKVVAPELYVAVGISGAVQHLAGMKDSKVIVAINNIANYGLVADLFKVLPELTQKIKKLKS